MEDINQKTGFMHLELWITQWIFDRSVTELTAWLSLPNLKSTDLILNCGLIYKGLSQRHDVVDANKESAREWWCGNCISCRLQRLAAVVREIRDISLEFCCAVARESWSWLPRSLKGWFEDTECKSGIHIVGEMIPTRLDTNQLHTRHFCKNYRYF